MSEAAAPSAPRLDWDAAALAARLAWPLPGATVEVAHALPSTSTELLERARLAAARPGGAALAPCLLVAERQTAGRGRLGRVWRSSVGASLTFSLSVPLAPADWSGLSLAVGAVLADALQPQRAPGAPWLGVKWPNDLWLLDTAAGAPGRKLGGVLIETIGGAGDAADRVVVVGIGLNVLPLAHEQAQALDAPVACLREIDAAATAPAVLARVAVPLAAALREFERAGYAAFAARFAVRDLLRDLPVTTTHAAVPAGVARGTAGDGSLRVEAPDGRLHLVASGEVSVRPAGRPEGAASGMPPFDDDGRALS